MSEQEKSVRQPPARRRGPLPMGGGGGPRFARAVDKPKDFKKAMRMLFAHLGPHKLPLFFALLATIAATVFTIIGPSLVGEATTTIFDGISAKVSRGGSIDFARLATILTTLVLLYLASSLFAFLRGFLSTSVVQRLAYSLRRDISEKLDRLPMRAFDQTTHGEILSRMTNDVDTVSESLGEGLSEALGAIATLIGVLIMMLRISVLMTVVALLLLPLSFMFTAFLIKRTQKLFVAQQAALGQANGLIEETYGGHDIVKAFNAEKRMESQFSEINQQLYDSAWKSQFFSGLMGPIMTLAGDIGYVAVALLGGYLAVQKSVTVGDVQAFIQYIRNFTQQIRQTAQITNLFQSMAAAAERVFEFVQQEEESDESDLPELEIANGEIRFENVSFAYQVDKPVIHNFSMKACCGQRIAIVGPTGAGKTTIVKLLMRFYDLDAGDIYLDNQPINRFTRQSVRRQMGMVLQETWLFNGTIRDNIRYGALDATDEEIYAAARAARADQFIQNLPGGYDMVINEEASNLSLGQKQLLTIARAFLANPKILILDEATSSVDTRTEILVKEATNRLLHGRTSFIIAHRLSTIRDADMILVMHEGDVIEQGTHAELLAAGTFYPDMYMAQFETSEERAT